MPDRTANPATGIARALATDRADTITELRYDLAFDIPASTKEPIRGRARIHFVLTDRSRPLVLDFRPGAAHVGSVSAAGSPVTFHFANGHLLIPADALVIGDNEVTVRFIAGATSLHRHPQFLYTLFVPARAHWAFPCFDQPDLKARFALELTVPADWQAIANGAETSRETSGDRARIRFDDTEPIPTYLFAFTAGRFQIETADRDGRTYRMFHREPDVERIAAHRDAVFDLHASALAWLERYTDMPYPFGKLDLLLVPAFPFSGMEHPGAIYYNAASMLVDEAATEQQLLRRASLIAHETAHMWFGDLVTMRWFDDVWMKEVFANFMAAKIVNPAFPDVDHDLRFLVSHYPAAYGVDRTEGTHPIREDLDNLDEAGSLYGAIIYQKAPVVMRQLERLMGEVAFRDGVREYLRTFAFGNATWLDLVRILDRRTDRDLAAWSRAWIEQAGRPHIRVDRAPDREAATGLTIVQSDPWPGRALRWPQQLDVLVGEPSRVRCRTVDMQGERTHLPAGGSATDFVLAAGGGLGYGDFELDTRSRAYLLEHVSDLKDPVTRGATWVTFWDEMLNGRMSPGIFVDAALRSLPHEVVEQNVQLIVGYLEDAFWRFLSPGSRQAVAPALERILRDGFACATAPSLRSTYFNAFRAVATTPDGVALLIRAWRRTEVIPGVPIRGPAEAVLALALAVRGVPETAAVLDEQLGRLDSELQVRFAFIMPAVSGDPTERDAFFSSLADPANRRREPWVTEALTYLHHPLRAPESERYVRPALDLLVEIQRTGDIFFPKHWVDATLGGHRSPAVAATVRAFLEERPDYPARLRRIVLQSADVLFRAVRNASME